MSPTLDIHGSIPAIVRNDSRLYEGDLKHYFQVVFNKAQNLRNPYHNFRHLCHVMWLSYKACEFYRDTLNPREMRNLLIASLFHDFDHTGKSGPDSVNIGRAIAGLVENLLPEDEEGFLEITRIIKATEYPYSITLDKLNLPCQIIRDADLSQALTVAWIQQVIFGLSEEWAKSPIEVLKMQEPFHKNLRFFTDWAKQEFPPEVIEQKVSEAQELIEILSADTGK